MNQWINRSVRCSRFGLFRFRSPLLSESRLLSFPPGTEMVHFPGFARARLWIQRAVCRFYRHGFPHSEIPGSKPACGSPRLIAACHVLHRLLLPRHPPCALSSLTIKFAQSTRFPSREEETDAPPNFTALSRLLIAVLRPPQQTHKALIKIYSAAHPIPSPPACAGVFSGWACRLPNLFSCQTSSIALARDAPPGRRSQIGNL
jgi:hypothetical protein